MIHVAGKYNIADSLSRLLGDTVRKTTHAYGAEEYVRFVAVQATSRALTMREVERASAEDEELSEVRKAIQTDQFSAERDTDCPTTCPTEQSSSFGS